MMRTPTHPDRPSFDETATNLKREMQERTGGFAFPSTDQGRLTAQRIYGMTLRDWFAGMALQGFCANPDTRPDAKRETVAGVAYSHADAMLKAREWTTDE